MGLENLKSVFAPNSSVVKTKTSLANLNSNHDNIISFKKTQLLSFKQPYSYWSNISPFTQTNFVNSSTQNLNYTTQYNDIITSFRNTNITSFLGNTDLDNTLPFNSTNLISPTEGLNFNSNHDNHLSYYNYVLKYSFTLILILYQFM